MQLQRPGHKAKDVPDIYSHVTRIVIDALLAAVHARWETFTPGTGAEH
ncbi:MAG TPA: hypothetical protein VJ914_03000 [Pseudonocardiaceae bacterium]|nr:hypothetical protein [Pseudonocardiaceae bacterium]